MNDMLSAFGSHDVRRFLVAVALPGLIPTLSMFYAAAWNADSPLRAFAEKAHLETALGSFAIAVFIGLVCEDLGARIEKALDDRGPDAQKAEWRAYLGLVLEPEPIGHKYLRSLVLRLKFELGSSVALRMAVVALWFWPTTYLFRFLVTLVAILLAVYLYREARDTHRVLGEVRHMLVAKHSSDRAPQERATAARA